MAQKMKYGFKSNRLQEINKMEAIILQKKREIEQRLAMKTGDLSCNGDKLLHSSSSSSSSVNTTATNAARSSHNSAVVSSSLDEKKLFAQSFEALANDECDENVVNSSDECNSVESAAENPKNRFRNDGSFLERFRKVQEKIESSKEQQKHNKCEEKQNNQSSSTTVKNGHSARAINPVTCKPHFRFKLNSQASNVASKTKNNLLIVSDSSQSTVELADEKEDESKEEREIRFAIEKTAIAVAMNGPKAEDLMKESTNNNINYSWLKDTESYNYKYFLRRVEELKSAKRRAEDEEVKGTSSEDKFVINLLPNTESDQSNEGGEKNNTKKRQRKSRWGDRSETYVPQDVGLIQYAIQVFGKTDLSPEQWKQLEDQRKMRILCEMMQAKQKHLQTLQNAGKVKYEYDSDEEIEGGTWEHKRRLQEMETTSKWAEMLTEHSKGKHHLGDFLPTEELEKFMQQWEAIKDKKASLLYESDYQNFKLQSDNVGYQLLKKMGWNEGESLGIKSDGITAPINKSVAGIGNAGLGHVRPHELKDGDDEYDAYRKRMMLAYRFRPNPLNNPRRAYY